MPFADGDRGRIAKALNLHRSQYFEDSCLAELMAQAEVMDSTHGTTFVLNIQQALAFIEQLGAEISAAAIKDGIKRKRVENQYEVEYQGTGSASANLLTNRQNHIDDIKSWLDEWDLLEAYVLTSRVIMTL